MKKSLQFIKACARMSLLMNEQTIYRKGDVYDSDGLDKKAHGYNHAA